MRDFFKKSSTFTKIEFWALTTIFAFVLFFFIKDRDYDSTRYIRFFEDANMPFRLYRNYFIPKLINLLITFAFVLYANFVLIPKLIAREALLRNIIVLVLVISFAGTVYSITESYLKAYKFAGIQDRGAINRYLLFEGFENALRFLWVLTIYTAIKYAGLYLLNISEKIAAKYKYVRPEAIVATIIWLVGLLLLAIGDAENELIIGWAVVVPSTIALYLFSFYKLIPGSLTRSKFPFLSYLLKSALIMFVAFFVIFLLLMLLTHEEDDGAGYSAFNSFFQVFITVPITWFLYKRLQKGNEEMVVLKKELGSSNAKLDFLRSQINPHFLFNAMNTLYGTAIQENAERTSEGIQRLSDMMRFMLQENMQEKISLKRELDYLNNYIDIQKLRTDPNPNIRIETDIQQEVNGIQIAPMLLIPFVENAFKHGISFREPSQIKIILEVKDKTVYFDVYNTKHPKPVNDPEKDKSGIGLNNVKQRLQLLYKDKHELVIRETAKGFFIHLTLQA